jgi:GC-rich sequence DNA-binding factor
MYWYQTLMIYGCQNNSQDPTSPDNKLMPSLVEKTVVHKLISKCRMVYLFRTQFSSPALVEDVWDPLSMKQSLRLASLVRKLVQEYPVINAENKTSQVGRVSHYKIHDLSWFFLRS